MQGGAERAGAVGRELRRLEDLADDGPEGLVERVKRGDHLAGASLYRRYHGSVRRYLLLLVKHADDADELAQQTFLAAFENLHHYSDQGERFSHWLFRIARNQAWDRLRKARRSTTTEPSAVDRELEHEPASTTAASRQDLLAFANLVDGLSPERQRTLALLYVLDLDSRQTGRVLGCTAAAVRQTHKRALAELGREARALGIA